MGWGGVRLLSQTRPIPRSPDGDNNRAKQFYQKKMKFSRLQWPQNEDDNENEDYVLEECFCDALGPTCTHLAVCGREEKVNHLGVVSLHTKV